MIVAFMDDGRVAAAMCPGSCALRGRFAWGPLTVHYHPPIDRVEQLELEL